MRTERGEGWELTLGTDTSLGCQTPMDVRVGSERRIANLAYLCDECGTWKHAYVKPAQAVPRFCSKRCKQKAAWKNTDFRKRCTDGVSGGRSYQWQGDAVSARGGRARALRLYPQIGPCSRCGAEPAERHHRDGDTSNNAAENIKIVCRRCHMDEDGRLEASRVHMCRVGQKGNATRWRR